MVLYLTDNTRPEEIRAAAESGIVFGCKYYPAGATTNSDSGVTDISNISEVLATLQGVGMVRQRDAETAAGCNVRNVRQRLHCNPLRALEGANARN